MDEIAKKFGHRIRVRACALIYQDDSLLIVKHKDMGQRKIFWAPPGGAVHFGESLLDALIREVKEETNIEIISAEFHCINEFIGLPLHGIEIFYKVNEYRDNIIKGYDPEMGEKQIIEEVKFVTFREIGIMNDNEKHNILHGQPQKNKLEKLSGHHLFFNPA